MDPALVLALADVVSSVTWGAVDDASGLIKTRLPALIQDLCGPDRVWTKPEGAAILKFAEGGPQDSTSLARLSRARLKARMTQPT